MADAPRHTAYAIFPDGTRVGLEVADTEAARARGMMFREYLGDTEGMLFPFDHAGRHAFWMKNVRIPLDIIWLDQRCRVVWIAAAVPPCTAEPCPVYAPEAKSWWVLELAAGFAERHGVAPGDTVAITPPRPPPSSSRKSRRARC